MLNDARYITGGDDESYDGSVSDSLFSMDYYREKARQFQQTMNQVDEAMRAANIAYNANISPEVNAQLLDLQNEFLAKRAQFRVTAEAINAGASVINSAGGRFPQLSIPQTLGLGPLVLPLAAIAAIGVAVGLITWGAQFVSGVNERLMYARQVQGLTPAQQNELNVATAKAKAAQNAMGWLTGGYGSLVKYGLYGLAAFLAWKAWQNR